MDDQLTLDLGAPQRQPSGDELRDAGMQCAADHAERVSRGWEDEALAHFIIFAAAATEPFLTEAVRAWAEGRGLPLAPDARSWGQVATRAKTLGYTKWVKYGKAKNASAHSGPRSLWIRA